MKINNPFKKAAGSQKLRHGGLATVVTAVFIAGVIVLNVIASLLVERFSLSADLTANRAFDLSSDTLTLIDSVKIPVKITVFAKESDFTALGNYVAQANEIIKLYAKKNSNITLQYVDPVKNPAALEKYSGLGVDTNYIVVESSLRKTVINPANLFNFDESTQQIISSKAEYTVSTALLSVTSETQPVVSFLSGHNEQSLTALQTFLSANNFQVKSQYLSTEGIDPKASVVVIGAPTNDYTADDLKKLDTFLYNGGSYGKNVVYFASATQGSLPNLESFLKSWGIQIGSGFIYETDTTRSYTDGTNLYSINNYTDTDFAGDMAKKNVYPAIAYSKAMTAATTSTGAKTAKTLLSFASTSVVAPVDTTNWDPSSAAKSANPSVIMGTTTVYQGSKAVSSNVVAVGSFSFVAENLLYSSSFTNGEYTLNLFNKIINREDVVPLLSKTLSGASIQITSSQGNMLTILFLGVTPVAVLIIGLYVWIRRRHL